MAAPKLAHQATNNWPLRAPLTPPWLEHAPCLPIDGEFHPSEQTAAGNPIMRMKNTTTPTAKPARLWDFMKSVGPSLDRNRTVTTPVKAGPIWYYLVRGEGGKALGNLQITARFLGGRQTAKPPSPVQIRAAPPIFLAKNPRELRLASQRSGSLLASRVSVGKPRRRLSTEARQKLRERRWTSPVGKPTVKYTLALFPRVGQRSCRPPSPVERPSPNLLQPDALRNGTSCAIRRASSRISCEIPRIG
jgi:hypothetical protein